LAALALLSGCGSESGNPGEAADTVTELQILYWPEGTRPSRLGRILGERRLPVGQGKRWTLECDPPGGTHPDSEETCKRLEELDNPFAETPEDEVCTEQYGGPQVASVSGVYRDETVNTRFARDDGCEIGRWQKHAFLIAPEP
jgi:hypothetical protein